MAHRQPETRETGSPKAVLPQPSMENLRDKSPGFMYRVSRRVRFLKRISCQYAVPLLGLKLLADCTSDTRRRLRNRAIPDWKNTFHTNTVPGLDDFAHSAPCSRRTFPLIDLHPPRGRTREGPSLWQFNPTPISRPCTSLLHKPRTPPRSYSSSCARGVK